MATSIRAAGRDVFFSDILDPSNILGGLVLTNGITNANFYAMIEIVCNILSQYIIQDSHGTTVTRDSSPLVPGHYFIAADRSVDVSNEVALLRTESVQTGTRVKEFTKSVRERDRRCIVTKKENNNAVYNDWTSFEAAHIFPLAYEHQWIEGNYSRWIQLEPGVGGSINSVQNGLLLRGGIHTMLDHYNFSINPDDNHKIIFFKKDIDDLAGSCLGRRLLDDPRAPADELLRWHFRQAVLTNMRGEGESYIEHDFPPGSDIMSDIWDDPRAGQRMEFELFNRLGAQMDIAHE